MGRTINQIFDEMIVEKNKISDLNGLNSTSNVAVWRLYFYVVATAIWIHEQYFEKFKTDLTNKEKTIPTGTRFWYTEQSKKFQFGDVLTWNNKNQKFEYSSTSTGDKIIAQASTIESNNQVRIKIAKNDGSGGLEPLSLTEQTAFETYINKIKFAGTNIAVTNIFPDKLKLKLNIVYDPLILTETGESILVPGTFPVVDTINNFISFLPFDGTFNRNEFIDAIQKTNGVVDPELILSEVRTGTNPFSETGQNYIADAGYLVPDPDFPLTEPAVINYIPKLK